MVRGDARGLVLSFEHLALSAVSASGSESGGSFGGAVGHQGAEPALQAALPLMQPLAISQAAEQFQTEAKELLGDAAMNSEHLVGCRVVRTMVQGAAAQTS